MVDAHFYQQIIRQFLVQWVLSPTSGQYNIFIQEKFLNKLRILTIKIYSVYLFYIVQRVQLVSSLGTNCKRSTNTKNMGILFNEGVRSGPKVKGWDSWSRDPGSIPSASNHFWFGFGVPFVLARSSQNVTLKIAEVYCVFAHSKCHLCLFAKRSRYRRAWV